MAARCRSRRPPALRSRARSSTSSLDGHVAPEPRNFFGVDVLADLFLELFLRFPGTVLLELTHHLRRHAGNRQKVRVGCRVEIERDEDVLLQALQLARCLSDVLADLP